MKSIIERLQNTIAAKELLVKRIAFVLAPFLILTVTVHFSFFSKAAPQNGQTQTTASATGPPTVSTAKAVRRTVTLNVRSHGDVEPRRFIDLAPLVSGRVTTVSPVFEVGASFKKGDVLLAVDDRDFRFRVTQARAVVAEAETQLAAELAEAAIARRNVKELGVDRPTPLALRQPQLKQARAVLASAEAGLADALLQLERTRITAPFDGRVSEKTIEAGGFANAGQPLGRIFASDAVEIAIPLTLSELNRLAIPVGFKEGPDRRGPEARVFSETTVDQHEWRGRLVRTSSEVDRAMRTVTGYVVVLNPYAKPASLPLAAGMFVEVEIRGKRIEDAVAVPRIAVRNEDQIFVIGNDDRLELRQASIAATKEDVAILTTGVKPNETVVTSLLPTAEAGDLVIAQTVTTEPARVVRREE